MTLTVTTDLSVNTGISRVEEKLEDKQKALRDSIEKGEPKIFGVSERRVMASFILKGSAQILAGRVLAYILYLKKNKKSNCSQLWI